MLGPRPSVQVRNPKALKDSYELQDASFGKPLKSRGGTTDKTVVVDEVQISTADGCESIQNSLNGKLALIERDARLRRLIGANDCVRGAEFSDSTVLDADLVLVGIGILPNKELALDAGLTCVNGIVVDREARNSNEALFAVGNCTERPLIHYDRSGRLESAQSAIGQGKLAAAALLGRERPHEVLVRSVRCEPSDRRLSERYDRIVVRGEPDERRFAVFYLRQNRLVAVDEISSPADFVLSKKIIAGRATPSPAAFAGYPMIDHVADSSA